MENILRKLENMFTEISFAEANDFEDRKEMDEHEKTPSIKSLNPLRKTINVKEETDMPPVDKHVQTSIERTGKEFRDVHEWLDGNPERKAERHSITKIYEYGKLIEDKYGRDALQEYIQHIHDDVKAKFNHIQQDIEKAIADTLAYFGVK